jgi:hypothetical protein
MAAADVCEARGGKWVLHRRVLLRMVEAGCYTQ